MIRINQGVKVKQRGRNAAVLRDSSLKKPSPGKPDSHRRFLIRGGKIAIPAHLQMLTLAALTTINTACTTVGPDYARPTMDIPAQYKEASATADPQASPALQGAWWKLYGDEQLEQLIAQVDTHNYSLQVIEARARQARAAAEIARAARYPTLLAGGTNDFGILANWEIDLWGRIRRNIEASGAAAQASEADLAAAQLSLQAQLAQNYFLLRIQDADIRLLQDNQNAYQRALQITLNQYAVGVADRSAVAQAEAQLGTTRAQLQDAQVVRSQLEHAIAVLIGKAPADFSLAAAPTNLEIPAIPSALPADLLKRRPDIAAAERRVASASAKIGVAEASLYPSLDLFFGATIGDGLLGGAKVVAPLFLGNSSEFTRSKARSAYEEAVADYRQTVLEAFREVEDNLAALRFLGQAAEAQDAAVTAARKAAEIMSNQYRAGIVNYQSVITAQSNALTNERAALNLHGRRLVASATLIKALGGGWASADTADPKAADTKKE